MRRPSSKHIQNRTDARLRREQFAAVSGVEGIHLSPEMRDAFEMFDREGWPLEKRRAYIIDRFKKGAT